MKIAHPFFPPATTQVWMHRFPLNRPRTNQSNLNDNVIKTPRLKPGSTLSCLPEIPLERLPSYLPHTTGHTLEDLHLRVRTKKELSPENFEYLILKRLKNSPKAPTSPDQEIKLHQSGICAILLIPLNNASPPLVEPNEWGRSRSRDASLKIMPPEVNTHMTRKPAQKLRTGAKHLCEGAVSVTWDFSLR